METTITPATKDGVTVSVAVKSLANGIALNDIRDSVAEGLKAKATISEVVVGEDEDRSPVVEIDKSPNSIPTDILLTESLIAPAAKSRIDEPVLPVGQNDHQDTVATAPTIAAPLATTESALPATTLRRRLEDTQDLIVCPGVYDGFSARIALSVGFDALYMVLHSHIMKLTEGVLTNVIDRCRHYCLPARPT